MLLLSISWSQRLKNSIQSGYSQAYADIGRILSQYNFENVQGNLYVTKNEDMANLFSAMIALRAMPWFPPTVRDIRAFRLEQWSDFTPLMKQL